MFGIVKPFFSFNNLHDLALRLSCPSEFPKYLSIIGLFYKTLLIEVLGFTILLIIFSCIFYSITTPTLNSLLPTTIGVPGTPPNPHPM